MVDYSALINASARIPGAFSAGLEAGQARRREAETRNALSAVSQNPGDRGAINALFQYDPRTALLLDERATEREQLAARQSAFGDIFKPSQAAPPMPSGAAPAPQQTTPQLNQEAFYRYMAIDPDGARQVMDAIGTMTEQQREQAQARVDAFAGIGTYLMSLPYEQRRAALAQQAQTLLSLGITPQQLQSFDPTDENLQAVTAQSMGAKAMFELRNDDREFRARQEDRAADNARADRGLSIREGALDLARQREGRIASGADGGLSDMSTDALIAALTGE